MSSMFSDLKNANKFEASDVIVVDATPSTPQTFLSITDNLWSILSITKEMVEFSPDNVLYGKPKRVKGEDSGYEALFMLNGTLTVVRESIKVDGVYNAYFEELNLSPDAGSYSLAKVCKSEFTFEGDSKGFEGAVALKGKVRAPNAMLAENESPCNISQSDNTRERNKRWFAPLIFLRPKNT